MSEVLHANAFFMITSAAVIVFTLFVCVAVIYVIMILRSIKRILGRIEAGTEVLSEDMTSVRRAFARHGLIRGILAAVFSTRKSRDDEE
jgi:hypothetical protein